VSGETRNEILVEAARAEREQAVLAAARDERRERKALEALGPRQPGWTEAEEQTHQAQLKRWLAASRQLTDALNALTGRLPSRMVVKRL
jgi:ribosomal protein S16